MRRLRPFFVITTALALSYLAWVFVSRGIDSARWTRRNQTADTRAADLARIYGGSEVRILQFYARDGNIVEGTKSVICYGVLNARTVRIEPAVSGVGPSLNRCVEVSAEKETRYTLIAEGADGQTVSESFLLGVHPDLDTLPKITQFAIAKRERDYTGKWIFSLTFRAQNPEEVSIDPPVFSTLHRSPMGAFYVAPEKTTTYTLTVTGKFGHKATRTLTVEVPPRA
jgi:hypothetical protein